MPRDDPSAMGQNGLGSIGPNYPDDYAARHREITTRLALEQIADAQGDVDAFIAQQSDKAKGAPRVAAQMAQRLLNAGRREEAWEAINAISEDRPGWIPFEWEQTRLDVLEALDRRGEAQSFRWSCFQRSLNATHLRAYLKFLPDFEDVEAEERAMAFALSYASVHQALAFLSSWPAPNHAAELVFARAQELNGDHYEILVPAANALEAKHPLAATLIRRAMIDFALENARTKRYRHAAHHLRDCESLASVIDDYRGFVTHDDYYKGLRSAHGRKSSFWAQH